MKELYIAPEAEIICFAPVEKLAADWENGVSLQSTASPNVEVTNPLDPSDGSPEP